MSDSAQDILQFLYCLLLSLASLSASRSLIGRFQVLLRLASHELGAQLFSGKLCDLFYFPGF